MLKDTEKTKQNLKKECRNFSAFAEFTEKSLWVISNAQGVPKRVGGANAKCNDSSTWSTLSVISRACRNDHGELPAIVLSKDSDLIFLDLDQVRNVYTDKLLTWAADLVQRTDSYTEISRSGSGLHIFLRGSAPILPEEKLKCKCSNVLQTGSDFELYFLSKFATVTGNILVNKPIRRVDEAELLEIYRIFFPEKPRPPSSSQINTLANELDDEHLLRLARSAKNGNKFTILFDQGEWEGPDDTSAKDLSLANLLAFYSDSQEQIKRLMKQSALIRKKWDREDYLDRTIEKALENRTAIYQGKIPNKDHGRQPIEIKLTTKTTGEPFPVSCLPKVLRDMALEIKRVSKTPIELCCGGVLSAGSIATRGFVKVFEKDELEHYTCFFFMIIAESGERKSGVSKKAMAPIYDFQEEDEKRFTAEYRTYSAKKKAISNEEKKILKDKNTSLEDKARLIEALQIELETYRPKPYRYITDDFTNPALFKLLDLNQGSFAVMSLDGGNVLDYIQGKGHGTDGTLNDSLLLKATWGDPISRDRKGNTEEGEHLFIRDPACHVTIVVQPDRCAKFLADPRLRGSGMIARILPITCTSEIGNRFESEEEVGFNKHIVAKYSHALTKFFKRTEILEVRLEKEAAKARRKYFNTIEREMAAGFSLEDLRDIGSKAATQVTRLAAFFQIYKDNLNETCEEIKVSEETWYEAEAVGRWILDQAAHLHRSDYDEVVLLISKEISEKLPTSNLVTNPDKRIFDKRVFQQRFKRELKRLTGKAVTDDVLGTSVSYQWIVEVPPSNGNWRTPRYMVNCGGKEQD